MSTCVSRILRMISSTICRCVFRRLQTSKNRGAALRPRPEISAACFMYSVHCCVNSLPITEMGSAIKSTEASIARLATRRPAPVTGTWSPYPTVMSVTIVHQKESGMDLYGLDTRSHPFTSEPSSAVMSSPYVASAWSVHTTSTLRA